jgi:hypothetical protein
MSDVLSAPPPATGLSDIMAVMPAYGSEFAKTYANHAPMVLVALDRLGGSPARLADFFAHYRDYKALLPFGKRTGMLTAETWRSAIGKREREPDLRAFFSEEVGRLGIDGALHTYLDDLGPGIGASALHALMRMAYGLLREDADDIAIALAYWAATYLEMPRSTGAAPLTKDPAGVLVKVSQIEAMHRLPLYELLWQNMAESGRLPEFTPVIDWLEIDDQSLARMANASIVLFAATMDFSALHAVTGAHWLRLVLPYSAAPDVMLRHFWQCVAALMREMGFPTLPDAETVERWRHLPVPSWETIKAAARQSYDEHDLSLVFTATQESAVYGDPLYQLAAARRVGLVPAYR